MGYSAGCLKGPYSLKAFFVEGGPVGNASVEEPDVDVVEVIERIDPFTTAVINLEAEVFRRSYFIVCWREIGS